MPVYDAALAILTRPSVQEQVQYWQNLRHQPAQQQAPDAAGWWIRYCFSALTSIQPITDTFWNGLYEDEEWMAFVHAGEHDQPPAEADLRDLLRRHCVRRHVDKASWLLRAWNEFDFPTLAQFGVDTIAEGASSRESELALVVHIYELLADCRKLGVGPKVARLMMIWDPEAGTMGSAFKWVIPLDRRWINALRREGVDISPNLSREVSYRGVEEEICAAAEAAGMLPFLADGAVFGWLRG